MNVVFPRSVHNGFTSQFLQRWSTWV